MHLMSPASGAEFHQFETVRVITAIFLAGVIPLITFGASQRDHHSYRFFSHNS
jgi:hypothetical protein